MKEVFYLHPDGAQQHIVHRPILRHLHGKRVSRVTPYSLPYRLAFKAIRWWYGDDGPQAEWTRRWRCDWQTFVFVTVEGEVELRYLGRFATRAEAVTAEVRCLETLLETVIQKVKEQT